MEGKGTQRNNACSIRCLNLDMYLVEIITETNVESHGMLRSNIERSTYSMEMKPPHRPELLFQGC